MRRRITYLLLVLSLIAGCTYFAPNKQRLDMKMEERQRELNSGAIAATKEAQNKIKETQGLLQTAVVTNSTASLASTNYTKATNTLSKAKSASELAEEFLRRNENLQGKPIEDQREVVMALLGENKLIREYYEAREMFRENQEKSWMAKMDKYEQRLQEYGAKYEEERNKKIAFWTKIWIGLAIAIGGPICLFVFFPPAISFFIGLFPALSSVAGVVPKVVSSNLTRAIGDFRWKLKERAQIDKESDGDPRTYTAQEVQDMFDKLLKQHVEEDRTTLKLVEHLREKNNV